MVRKEKAVVKKEMIFVLLILIIFVSLLITWTVVSNVEESTEMSDSDIDSYADNTGAKVNIKILSEQEITAGNDNEDYR